MRRFIRVQALVTLEVHADSLSDAALAGEQNVRVAIDRELPAATDVMVRALDAVRPPEQARRWWEPSRWDRKPGWT